MTKKMLAIMALSATALIWFMTQIPAGSTWAIAPCAMLVAVIGLSGSSL